MVPQASASTFHPCPHPPGLLKLSKTLPDFTSCSEASRSWCCRPGRRLPGPLRDLRPHPSLTSSFSSSLSLRSMSKLCSLFEAESLCRPGWPQSHYIAEDDLELMVCLSQPPECYYSRLATPCLAVFEFSETGFTLCPRPALNFGSSYRSLSSTLVIDEGHHTQPQLWS